MTGNLVNALDRGDSAGIESILTGNQELFNNIGDKSFTVDSFRNVYQQDPDLARKMAVGTFMASGGKRADLVGAKEGAEYSNFYWDDDGNPHAFNKQTEQYERIQSQAPRGKASPQTIVKLGGEGRSEEQKALAKSRVKRYEEIQGSAEQAESELNSVQQLRAIDLETGFGTEEKAQLAKAINFLGGDGESLLSVDISNVEKFNAVVQKQLKDAMATEKGPQTDQDAARISKTLSQLGNTTEGNKFIMSSMEALGRRRIEQENFWTDYLEDSEGNTLKGVDKAWRQYKNRTPMFSDVVRNPETNNPMFFYQFRDLYTSENYDESEIIDAWRQLNKGKK